MPGYESAGLGLTLSSGSQPLVELLILPFVLVDK